MPPKSDLIRIRHALDAAEQAMEFTAGLSLAELKANTMASMATLHAIVLVGEALNQVTAAFQDNHPAIPWRLIVGMRHRLVHGYDDIDHQRVLDTVRNNFPALAESLAEILAKES